MLINYHVGGLTEFNTYSGKIVTEEIPGDFKIYRYHNLQFDTIEFAVSCIYDSNKYQYAFQVTSELFFKDPQALLTAFKFYLEEAGKSFMTIGKLSEKGTYLLNNMYSEFVFQQLTMAENELKVVNGGSLNTSAAFLKFADIDFGVPMDNNSVGEASRKLPGMETKVACPALDCSIGNPLWNVVQHLNDRHKWTREAIADWLDELHDAGKVNIEFEPWDDEVGLHETDKDKV